MRIGSKYKNGILIKLEIIIVIFNDDKSCFFVQSRTLRRWVTVVENNSSIVTFISNLFLFYSVSISIVKSTRSQLRRLKRSFNGLGAR